MSWYAHVVLPRLIDCACGLGAVTRQRRKVVPLAEGRVLEVGIGSGRNLPHYDPARVTSVLGVDPGSELLRIAQRRAASAPFPVEFIPVEGETVAVDAHSIDTVVVTYTLCTIPGVHAALAGMRRALKPGGRLLFCEHGLAPDAAVARFQSRLEPLWGRLFGGCHLTRDVPALLREGGFRVELTETAYLRGAPRFAGFHYVGSARPDVPA
jgi:SAM-dependent methyltransferase